MQKNISKEDVLEYLKTKRSEDGNVSSNIKEISLELGYKSSNKSIIDLINELKSDGALIEVSSSRRQTTWFLLEQFSKDSLYDFMVSHAKDGIFDMKMEDIMSNFQNVEKKKIQTALIVLHKKNKIFVKTTTKTVFCYMDYNAGKQAISNNISIDTKQTEEIKQIKNKKSIRKSSEYYDIKVSKKENSIEENTIKNIANIDNNINTNFNDVSVLVEPKSIQIEETDNSMNFNSLRIFDSKNGKAVPVIDIAEILGVDSKTLYALINRNQEVFEDFLVESPIRAKGHNLKSLSRDGVLGLMFLLNHNRSSKKEELIQFKKWAMKALGQAMDNNSSVNNTNNSNTDNSSNLYTEVEIDSIFEKIENSYVKMKETLVKQREDISFFESKSEELKNSNERLIAKTVFLSNRILSLK